MPYTNSSNEVNLEKKGELVLSITTFIPDGIEWSSIT